MSALRRMDVVRVVGCVLALGMVLAAPAMAGSTPPPTIDQILGTYDAKISGTDYDLNGTLKESSKDTEVWVITKIDDVTVNIETSGEYGVENIEGYYKNGKLLVGFADDDILADEVMCAVGEVSGSPGKVQIRGQCVDYNTTDGEAYIGKFQAKQRPAP